MHKSDACKEERVLLPLRTMMVRKDPGRVRRKRRVAAAAGMQTTPLPRRSKMMMESDATRTFGPSDSGGVADAWCEFDVRRPSLHRRHGNPFPLPRIGQQSALSQHFLSPSRMIDRAAKSLNKLASSGAIFSETSSSSLPLTDVQRWVMDG